MIWIISQLFHLSTKAFGGRLHWNHFRSLLLDHQGQSFAILKNGGMMNKKSEFPSKICKKSVDSHSFRLVRFMTIDGWFSWLEMMTMRTVAYTHWWESPWVVELRFLLAGLRSWYEPWVHMRLCIWRLRRFCEGATQREKSLATPRRLAKAIP